DEPVLAGDDLETEPLLAVETVQHNIASAEIGDGDSRDDRLVGDVKTAGDFQIDFDLRLKPRRREREQRDQKNETAAKHAGEGRVQKAKFKVQSCGESEPWAS